MIGIRVVLDDRDHNRLVVWETEKLARYLKILYLRPKGVCYSENTAFLSKNSRIRAEEQ